MSDAEQPYSMCPVLGYRCSVRLETNTVDLARPAGTTRRVGPDARWMLSRLLGGAK